MSEECARNKVRELQISNSKKSQEKITPDRTRFNKLYWISRKGMDEKSAIKKISEIQSELSSRSSKYKGKKSTKERNEKISSTVSKHIKEVGGGEWAKHFGDFSSGVSKIERSFFESIKKETGKELKANVPIGNYIVDVLFGKKVVEFYGDYWHANPNKFDSSKIFYNNKLAAEIWEKDLNRVDWLRSEEYDVMIVWESDWRLDKENCIKRIKEYYGTIN
jgi:very-short-patch-repair endonuclease